MTSTTPQRFHNWAGQFHCTPRRVHRASSREEVQAAFAAAACTGSGLRVLGAGLSPSDIAMSDEDLLILDGMSGVIAIDRAAGTIRVQAGARLADITAAAAPHGLAFPVLGSVSDQTIAGAIATAVHGTGLGFGVLSTLVSEIELVTPTSEIIQASSTSHRAVFDAARCGLGVLGVITELTLHLSPAFDLAVEESASDLEAVLTALPERLRQDHYRFWYLPHADVVWEWQATRHPPAPEAVALPVASWWRDRLLGYHVFEFLLYLGAHLPACIPLVNRWYAHMFFRRPRTSRARADRLFNIDCLFRQHVDEWAIPVAATADALRGLRDLIARQRFPAHLPIEVRFVQGDDIWLSPSFGRDSCYIGVIAYMPYGRNTRDHAAFFAAFEQLMARFDGRPHWAKRFGPDAAWLQGCYPRWADFQRVRAACDPAGRMRNRFTDRVLGKVTPAPSPVADLVADPGE